MVSPGRLEEAIRENHPLMKSTFCLLYVLHKDSFITAHKRCANYISLFTEYEIKLARMINVSRMGIYFKFECKYDQRVQECLILSLEYQMSHYL